MAVPDSTFQTYQSIGNREDLIDIITNIDPVDTQFTNRSGNAKATGVYHEWQTDALAAAAANAQIEGDDAAASAVTPTTRAGNYCQIVRKVYQISDTQEAIEKAGRGSEIGYQTTKALKELARDIEYACIVNTATASGASGTARQTKGLAGWITTNIGTGTGTGNETLTETMLNDCLSLVWAAGGKPQTIFCGSWQKRKIDAFTTNTRQIQADSAKLVAAVDIYKSSFGVVTVELHHQVNTTIPGTLFIIGDWGLWKQAYLRPIKKEQLARTGASTKFMIEAEFAVEARQEKGSGRIYQLATS